MTTPHQSNVEIPQSYPRVTVGAFIFNHQGQILLTKSPKWGDYWIVCGGHIDLGETIAQALVREVKEEVGLDVEFVRVIGVHDFINNPHFYKPYHFIGLQCQCLLKDNYQIPTIDNQEIIKTQWFDLDKAIQLTNILPETKQSIEKILNSQTLS